MANERGSDDSTGSAQVVCGVQFDLQSPARLTRFFLWNITYELVRQVQKMPTPSEAVPAYPETELTRLETWKAGSETGDALTEMIAD